MMEAKQSTAPAAVPAVKRGRPPRAASTGGGTYVITQPAAPTAPVPGATSHDGGGARRPRRRGGRSRGGGRGGGINMRASVAAAIGAYGSQAVFAGKTIMGVPQSGVAAIGVQYVTSNADAHAASLGAIGAAVIEYRIEEAIAENKLAEFLKPYIDGAALKSDAAKANAKAILERLTWTVETVQEQPPQGPRGESWESIAARHAG